MPQIHLRVDRATERTIEIALEAGTTGSGKPS
jgi:hypothetical protein